MSTFGGIEVMIAGQLNVLLGQKAFPIGSARVWLVPSAAL
jgi:hypothetical protein